MARRPDPKLHAIWRDRIRRQEASGLGGVLGKMD